MNNNFKIFHTQTLVLKRNSGLMRSELCLASGCMETLQNKAQNYLHPKELAYFEKLTFEKRKLSYLLGRFLAKQAISRYISDIQLSDIFIDYGIFQFPVVHCSTNDRIQVTYSHCDNLGMALAYPEAHPMGVDLELIDFKKNSVIETILSEAEIKMIHSFSGASDNLYTLCWTIKEALSKILRTGMMTPFELFEINKLSKENNYWESEFKNFSQYKSLSFSLDKYICSIVYPRKTQLTIDISAIQHEVMK